MSVIGIDFGNEGCYVACAKAGGIETLANDYSLRATPSFVAFDGKKRIIGVAAKNQQVTNMKNTVSGFKRLLGRKFNDPHVQRELSIIPTRIELLTDGGIGYRVNYLDKEQLFTPEQLTAMLFTKLKETSSQAIQAQVNDCVICCPIYYTNAERRALLDAAQIAGLNVLRLMNETTATALSYGFYKNDLREDKARNVIFVDCGHSSLQVSACAFSKGKLKMLASTWDHIGGRDFDSVLAEHFIKEFNERYKLNVKKDARAYLRLLTELEKLKKQMSANSTKLPINIECFMNDIDVSSSMQRTKMEELCDHLFERVAITFKRLLQESKLSLDDIHSVEIVGGSSRIPAIKQLIEQIFGKPASTTLNQDESVARGATLQCAIMSPGVRVRDFGVTDIQNYPIKVSWDAEGSVSAGEVELFPSFHPAPFSRLLTLHRREPFTIIIQYAPSVPYPDLVIGHAHIKDVKPNEKGEYQEVKVKVRINLHGIVVISNAALVDKKENEEAAVSAINEQTMAANNDDKSSSNVEQQQSAGEPMDIVQEGADKKKKSTKWIELPLKFKTHGLSPTELNNLMHLETKMVASDTQERERVDARNALEEYVYDMRNKLQGGPFEDYVVVSERDMICNELDDIESWLYDDGEECERDTYVNKLKALYARTDVIKQRAYDYQYCPAEFDELTNAIHYSRTVIKEYRKGLPKYEHLTETDLINISEAADKAQNWLEDKFGEFTKASRITDSPVKIDEIRNEVQALYNCVNSVINRPKVKCTSATTTPSSNSTHGNANNTTKAGSASTQGQNGDTAAHHRADDAEGNAPDESYDLTMDVE